jgi:DMSO/TMAO reductase YedYZ molybdopterin-dependent catalytic subunit
MREEQEASPMEEVGGSLGAWIGGLLAIPLVSLLDLGHRLWDLPFVPYDVWNWQTHVVPGNVLSLAVNGLGFQLSRLLNIPNVGLGKRFEQAVALLLAVGASAVLGAVVAWGLRQRGRGAWLVGVGVGLLRFAAVVAIESSLGFGANVVASLVWLSVLYLGWGVSTGVILDGKWLASLRSDVYSERRQGFVSLVGAALGGALALWGIGHLAEGETSPSGAGERLTKGSPTPTTSAQGDVATTEENMPVGEDGRIIPVPGTRPEVTPKGQFYLVDISTTPVEIDGETWTLTLDGLFEKTSALTLEDLRAYPMHTQPITMCCISNPTAGSAISTAYWTGLRLKDLLEDLGIKPEANYLFLESADGFYETVTMTDMMDPQTLLVYGMNDRTLPNKHGYPLRIYIPNRYGMKQPKWIMKMTATEEDQGGYWTDRGWSKEARPHITSVIDVVAKDAMHDGLVPVGGVAWAGDRGVQKVELKIDAESWREVTLRTPPLGPLTWVQWRYEWPASPGRHTLTVRATDGEGELQTAKKTPVRPNGPTGYHVQRVTI